MFKFGRPRHVVPNIKLSLLLVFGLFLLALLPVVISSEGLPHALRAILLSPSAMLLAALGAKEAYFVLKRHIHSPVLKSLIFLFITLVILETFSMYFFAWGPNKNTADAFAHDHVALGKLLNAIPNSVPKYIIINGQGVLVNGLPMPTQTVMFITDTYSREKQELKNIH